MAEKNAPHPNTTRVALALPLLLIIAATATTLQHIIVAQQTQKKPIAIGFGENERYILYSNGELHKLLEHGKTTQIAKINMSSADTEASLVDFEVYGENLYLYAYRSLNETSGQTAITVFNIGSGEKIFQKTYTFTVTGENRVNGNMVLAASACRKGFAVITANTTHSTIEVYKTALESFKLSAKYSGRMAMTIQRYGDVLLAPTFRAEIRDSTPWITPRITDLIENRTLFELPALIPVAALAYPFIQAFNRNGSWECYVTVNNPRMNRIEHYVVYPEKQRLIDSRETAISPYLEYLVMSQPTGSKITFKSGENITVPWRLTVIPQGSHIPIDPKNGILDANPADKVVIAKIVEGGRAKILYVTESSSKEIYSLSAEQASKIKGFYAALTENTVYIIDPEKQELIPIPIEEQKNGATATMTLLALAFTVLVAATLTILVARRKRSKIRLTTFL
ncbi:MAG: hypothetical protein QW236_07120 [Candidatus Bathyarchaeia archaeon]